MVLGGLAHDEGVQVQAARGGGVQHGGGHRVGPHGQTADGVDVVGAQARLLQHVEHDVADEGGGLVMERGAAHVHVEVGLEAGGEGDLASDDGQLVDELGQTGDVGIVGAHDSDGSGREDSRAGWTPAEMKSPPSSALCGGAGSGRLCGEEGQDRAATAAS